MVVLRKPILGQGSTQCSLFSKQTKQARMEIHSSINRKLIFLLYNEEILSKMDINFEFPKILVGVAGGSASGKTTLCTTIVNEMQVDKQLDLLILSVDDFQFGIQDYKGPIEDFNFDDPHLIDWELLILTIQELIEGKTVYIPHYDFVVHKRVPKEKWTRLESRQIIFLEGIFALWHPKLRSIMNYKIFIDCDNDIRLCRRLIRDIESRGRDVLGVLTQCQRFVKPAYEIHILPTKKHADIVVPGFKDNRIAVNLLVQQLKHQNKELNNFRNRMTRHLVFFGDILHDLQICVGFFTPLQTEIENSGLSMERDSLQRKVFFTNDRQTQKELIVFIRYFARGEEYSIRQYQHTLKTLLKYSFPLLKSALHLKQFDTKNLNVLPLTTYNESGFNESGVNFVVIIPYLCHEEDQKQLITMLAKAEELNVLSSVQIKQIKLIIINMFAHIANIMAMTNINHKSFLCLINVFMIASKEKFQQTLQKCKDADMVKEGNNIFANYLAKVYQKKIGKM